MQKKVVLKREGIRVLQPDEGRKLLDNEARRYLNMSGEDFLRAWDEGKIPDPDRAEVMRVAMLLPLCRPAE